MNIYPNLIRTQLVFGMIIPDGPDRPVRADLNYRPDDPYAVRVTFHTGTSETIEWTFARSLLNDGMSRSVGEGDVQVWPGDDPTRGGLCIGLSSPSGRALFNVQTAPLTRFLRQTYELVADGHESDFVDLDAELYMLLSDR